MSPVQVQVRGDDALAREASFDALVRAEQAGLMRIAWRFTHDPEDARDLVQAALADAFERRHTLGDATVAAGWLRRILVNRAINQHRRRRVWATLQRFLPMADEIPPPPGADVAVDRARRLSRVRAEIAKLPARQAAAFTLRYLEALSLDEVADSLGIGRGTARVHLYRALKTMREAIASEEKFDAL